MIYKTLQPHKQLSVKNLRNITILNSVLGFKKESILNFKRRISNISDLSDEVKQFTPEQSFNVSQLSKSNKRKFNAEMSYDQIRKKQYKLPKFGSKGVRPSRSWGEENNKSGLKSYPSLDASLFDSKSDDQENVLDYKSPFYHAISKLSQKRRKYLNSCSNQSSFNSRDSIGLSP